MKLTKEQVYINLKGKTKEELTDLWEFLTSNGEKVLRCKKDFLKYGNSTYKALIFYDNEWGGDCVRDKTEITIEQLKQIIKPMGTFTPIAMKCTQEQFDAVKPKLTNCKIGYISDFVFLPYLVNNADNEPLRVYNLSCRKNSFDRVIHETWNEEIFLKACGIEVETLQEKAIRLENELKEVNQQIEDSKIKVGSWLVSKDKLHVYKVTKKGLEVKEKWDRPYDKITNTELIKLLENLYNE